MIHGGFRDRWQRQGLARQLDSENDQLDDLQQGLFDGCLEDQMGSADESWNHVGFADGVGSPAFDAVNQSTAHMSFMDDSRSFSMTPKPKSRPQISSSSSSVTLGIKRTADEFALHSLHRQMSVLKRPGQKGPLAASFSKPKAPWEGRSTGAYVSVVGMADHISASDSAAAISKQIRQMETTVQSIRTARFVTTDDDYRCLSLSRYKTMVLLEVDATRLGLSLTFAGTLCSSDDLALIFNDVFAPKPSGTLLKRCNAMWRFSCRLQKKFLGSLFNQPEDIIYAYVCHLRRNTSLRIKDECLIFTTAKICSNVNKLTRQKKKRNQNLPLTQTLKHRLSSTCHCEFFISVFSVSREGGWEFHPFLRAALGKDLQCRPVCIFQHFLEPFSQLEPAVECALQLFSCFVHTAFHRGWFGYVHLQIYLLVPGWNLNQVQSNNLGQMRNVLLMSGR